MDFFEAQKLHGIQAERGWKPPADNPDPIQNISPEAKAVEVSVKHHKDWRGHDVQEVNFAVPGTDFAIGTKVKEGNMILLHIGSASWAHAKRGYGFATMQRAIKYAADNHLRFFVNEFVPREAWPLVHKLARHGYDIVSDPDYGGIDGSPSLEIGTVPESFTPFEYW